jgi:hypothetical protein
MRRSLHLIYFLSCLLLALSALAQEGHPLTGTWSGDWGATPTQRTHLTLVMGWDGRASRAPSIPTGRDSARKRVRGRDELEFVSRRWKDASGKAVHTAEEDRGPEFGAPETIRHRTQGTTKGDSKSPETNVTAMKNTYPVLRLRSAPAGCSFRSLPSVPFRDV